MYGSPSIELPKESAKNRITVMIKLSAVFIPFLAIYWQDLDIVFREALVNDFMNYIVLLPFLIGFIIFRKRKMLQALSPLDNCEQDKLVWISQVVTGTSLLSISFIIYFLGSYTPYALEYHLLSIPLFVSGSIALAFNLEIFRQLLFPLVLLFFMQTYLIQIANPFWSDLSWISSTTSYNLLSTLNIPAKFTTVLEVPTIEITTIDGTTLPFTVGVASSGLNSFMGFTVFAIFVAYILREPLWKRITLMLTGYPLLILLNILRITIILGLAYQWGSTISEIFHFTGGIVLIFTGTLLLLLLGEKIWKIKIRSTAPSPCTHHDENLRKGYNFCLNCGRLVKSINHTIKKGGAMKMTIVILLTVLFLVVQTPPIALAKPPTETDLTEISAEESKQLLPAIPGWDLQFLYRDTKVERILKQDAALAFAYISPATQSNSSYAYIFVGVQISTSRHTWESSLITWPARYGRPAATVVDLRDVRILQNPTLTARFFAYQRPESNLTEVVLYWFERVPFKINSVWDMRNVQISLLSRSYDLSRSGLISNPNDLSGVEKLLLPFAQSIAKFWEPIRTSSQMMAIISQNGDKLVVTAGVLLTGTFIAYVLERRKAKKANTNAYQKLSKPNKEIIDTVHQTEKITTPTLNAITKKYQGITGENISKENLLLKLLEAEKIGVIKNRITNKQDEPIQVWKTQVPFNKNK